MYLLLKEVNRVVSDRKLYIHCAGHSLGAHACGFLGKHLIADAAERPLDRISGMDPAGPLFCNDVPYPFDKLNISPSARLGPHDARLVDNIHTDGDARYFSVVPQVSADLFVVWITEEKSIFSTQYGTLENLGTVDFYPGAPGYYGHDQPRCYDVFNVVSCSHSRAWEIYLSSITSATCLAGKECHGDPHMIPKNCADIVDHAKIVTMGYWWDERTPGLYTVDVTGTAPYCKPPKNTLALYEGS